MSEIVEISTGAVSYSSEVSKLVAASNGGIRTTKNETLYGFLRRHLVRLLHYHYIPLLVIRFLEKCFRIIAQL